MLQVEGPQANVDRRQGSAARRLHRSGVAADRRHLRQPSVVLPDDAGQRVRRQGRTADALGGHADPAKTRGISTRRPRPARTTANRQFTESGAGRGIHGPGTDARFRATSSPGRTGPLIGHEIGQWTFFPNFDEMKKYTGVLAAKNFETRPRRPGGQRHLLDLAPQFVQATGKHAVLLYKEEIEVLLRTPGYAGLLAAGPARLSRPGHGAGRPARSVLGLQGLRHAGGSTAAICGPTVPLLRMQKRTFTTRRAVRGDGRRRALRARRT